MHRQKQRFLYRKMDASYLQSDIMGETKPLQKVKQNEVSRLLRRGFDVPSALRLVDETDKNVQGRYCLGITPY